MIHVGDTMSTSGDFQYIRGDTMSISKGYHEYIGDVQYIEVSIEIKIILSRCSPTCIMISLRCTKLLPLYS